MKHLFNSLTAIFILGSIASCSLNKNEYDASGSFEAVETIISSEATGVIKQFNLEEGDVLEAGKEIGYIDSTQLALKRKQLEAQIVAVLSKKPNVPVQIAVLQEQLRTAETEQKRISALVKADAAPTKQLDDINAQVDLIRKQIAAQQSTLSITSEGISMETAPLEAQVAQVKDQIEKCVITNPVGGTVIAKYAEPNEMAAPGKPLYKIADLRQIILRTYITGDQLPKVKIGEKVKVLTDDGKGNFHEAEGTVTWISDKAEFTPKTIQTKDERANLVYAMKVLVDNDGTYKIGMYGEIKFL